MAQVVPDHGHGRAAAYGPAGGQHAANDGSRVEGERGASRIILLAIEGHM